MNVNNTGSSSGLTSRQMSRGDSYGSKPIAWRSKKRVLNKTTGPRSGKAYTKVRRVDGTYGHDYGGGKIVWLKGKGL